MKADNLFDGIPAELSEELFTTLLHAEGLRIERIVSHGQASPSGFWYDQEENEWILVLEGRAVVEFENDTERVEMLPGSHLNIPAHARHRVAWTAPDEKTIWLAVYYRSPVMGASEPQ